MTSTVFGLWTADDAATRQRMGSVGQGHSACESCHMRKQKCIAGQGACQACATLGIVCQPRARGKIGRPRGSRQSSWRADLRTASSSSSQDDRPKTSPKVIGREGTLVMPIGSPWNSEAGSLTETTFDLSNASDDTTPATFDWLDMTSDPLVDFGTDFNTFPSMDFSTDDIQLHNVLDKIRTLHTGRPRGAGGTDSRGVPRLDTDASIVALEELSQILRYLGHSRTLYLFGIAVLWAAIELSQLVASDLIVGLTATNRNSAFPTSPPQRSDAAAAAAAASQARDFAAYPSAYSRPASLPRWSSRGGALTVSLTRLGACLGEFMAFIRKCEDFSDPSHPSGFPQRPTLDCRAGITTLLERITPYIHMFTSTWSTWAQ